MPPKHFERDLDSPSCPATGSTTPPRVFQGVRHSAAPPRPSKRAVSLIDNVRARLRQWQELNGVKLEEDLVTFGGDLGIEGDTVSNSFGGLPEPAENRARVREMEAERETADSLWTSSDDGLVTHDSLYGVQMGDLVELHVHTASADGMLGVFVRRIGREAQLLTIEGRWCHALPSQIHYTVSSWVSPSLVRPLLDYAPSAEQATNRRETRERAEMEDISTPREISGPLLKRMTQFQAESDEIYRKHSSALDNAHAALAHPTDLRHASLISIARRLLNIRTEDIDATAIFTVRKALSHAGFGFTMDTFTHRLTGHVQIRSEAQCKMVENVRRWIRAWQETSAEPLNTTSKDANTVSTFLREARQIVLRSRKDRAPTRCGNVGPSQKRYPISDDGGSMRIKPQSYFNEESLEIIRFLEAWCCSRMFTDLTLILSLPPLLLRATGLYPGHQYSQATGILFLQELGAILPFENTARHDQHLLLPESHHSKPLQKLVTAVADLEKAPGLHDSMRDLRHDWGELPVYCIDSASAREIDDGLSIEAAGVDKWWVHIHVANPTAFFHPGHNLAKMARHMGSTVYLPEQTYPMLPRWASEQHFSLKANRPCLTFSAKINANTGNWEDSKIQPGIVRNVLKLSRKDVAEALGMAEPFNFEPKSIVVGGIPPSFQETNPITDRPNSTMIRELSTLIHLSTKSHQKRGAAGALLLYKPENEISVWQDASMLGLKTCPLFEGGLKHVEGDPIIRLQTSGMTDWLVPVGPTVSAMVSEFMVMACHVAATWCTERNMPAIYNGIVDKTSGHTPQTYLQEVLEPARRKWGSTPYLNHLSLQYLRCFGSATMSATPVNNSLIGLDQYTKVTSPLRRYGDMIMHWQIEAALREESRLGKSLVTNKHTSRENFLPFPKQALNTIMLGLRARDVFVKRSTRNSSRFWISQLLFRAIYFRETELPLAINTNPSSEVLEPVITHATPGSTYSPQYYLTNIFIVGSGHKEISLDDHQVPGVMTELDFENTIMIPPQKLGLEMAKVGDVWECEIVTLHLYNKQVIVRPRRLVHRFD